MKRIDGKSKGFLESQRLSKLFRKPKDFLKFSKRFIYKHKLQRVMAVNLSLVKTL